MVSSVIVTAHLRQCGGTQLMIMDRRGNIGEMGGRHMRRRHPPQRWCTLDEAS
jgi:hypothetical protein